MTENGKWLSKCLLLSLAATGLATERMLADGTEMLGTPGVAIVAEAGGFVSAGVGLAAQPADIQFDVPADAQIRQVLLYWAGEFRTTDDDALTVNGVEVAGDLIGGPTFFYTYLGQVYVSSYRADITDLGIVTPGANTLTLTNLDYDELSSGAGVLVIYGDCSDASSNGCPPRGRRGSRGRGGHGHGNGHGSPYPDNDGDDTPCTSISVFDGADLAFYNFPEPRRSTVPQTFNFEASDEARVANLALFTGSVEADRPNEIILTIDGIATEIIDLLGDTAGTSWDAPTIAVDIPAGADNLTVEIASTPSTNPLGASVLWVTAALSVPQAEISNGGNGHHGDRPWWWYHHGPRRGRSCGGHR